MKKNILFSVLCAFLIGTQCLAQEILLADQVFVIKVTEKNANGRVESMPGDELVLKANQISASFSIKNGFAAVPYTVTQQPAPSTYLIDISAESTNSKKETLKWTGTINGNSIKGKAERMMNGKPAGEYTFNGTLKKKK